MLKKLAKRNRVITRSKTLAVAAKAGKLKKQGEDIVTLTVGEPDFPTPLNIKETAFQAIKENFTRYTGAGGTDELKSAIVDKYKKDFDVDITPANVIVSNGAKHSIVNVVLSICDPGDEVLIPTPSWVSYPHIVRLAGARPRYIYSDETTNFKITAKMLRENITPQTKLLILCSPSNPSGSVYTKQELVWLAKVIEETGIYVIFDEIYEKLIYREWEHYSMIKIDKIRENVICVNGVSKSYAMTGWRIGYAVADKKIINAAHKFQSHTTSNPNSIAQMAALEAISGDQSEIEKMRKVFEERCDKGYKLINSIPHTKCFEPKGAFYFFVDFSYYLGKSFNDKVIETVSDLCDFFIDEIKVAVVTGEPFGSDKHVRFSFACSDKEFKRGVDRIKKGLKLLK